MMIDSLDIVRKGDKVIGIKIIILKFRKIILWIELSDCYWLGFCICVMVYGC